MSQKFLLKEYYAICSDGICDVSLLTESEKKLKDAGYMVLSGKLQQAEQKNGNNRVYRKMTLQREDQNYQKLIRENRALGELDHSEQNIIELKNVSHQVMRTWWGNDDCLYGTIKILNTPSGNIVKNLVNDGVQLGISSRGLGSVTETRNGTMVNDDFVLICYDLVSDPSTMGAFMLKESKMRERDVLTKADRIYRSLNSILKVNK